MKRARNTLKKWLDKHYPKIPPLTTAALATMALIAAGCGSSQTTSTTKPAQPTRQQQIQQQREQQRNVQRDTHILTVINDWATMSGMMQPMANHLDRAGFQEWDKLIGSIAKLKIDLVQLRPYLTAEQQAQLDGYMPALTDFQDGAKAGAVGDYMTSTEKWAGVASQIGELGKLIVSLENESGGNA